MNNLKAYVTKINNLDNLNVVNFNYKNNNLSMMSLELGPNIKIGTEVLLCVKASHIGIAKDFKGLISFANFLPGKISKIDLGQVLTSIKIDCDGTQLTSIITTASAKRMDLKTNDLISAVIKSSEIYVQKVLND